LSDTAIITDGYTRTGYIAAAPGLHPAVTFQFRPMLSEHVIHWRDALNLKPTHERKHIMGAGLTDGNRVLSWDIAHPETKETVPVTSANIRRLHPLVMAAMFDIVCGWRASDKRPGEATTVEEINAKDEADATGRYLADIEQEGDAKNCSAVSSL
jgi:hypothetical protein